MAILIDPPRPEAHGRRWSHLVSDTSLDELHRFARSVGIPERGFEGDHYDIPEERYASVVAAGARPTPARELLRALQASGLRMQKRRGDKGVARVRGIRFVDGTTADVDLIRSDREADEARVFAAMAFVQRRRRRLRRRPLRPARRVGRAGRLARAGRVGAGERCSRGP